MKNLLKFFAFALLITAVSCNAKNAKSPAAEVTVDANISRSEKTDQKVQVEAIERKIIKTGDIHFETSNAGETRTLLTQSVTEFNGYISQDNISENNRYENNITIRVPAAKFDALVARISENAKSIDSKNISASDVTEEYIDIEARVKTKKELEERYKELVKQANKMEDILTIEKEIGALRADIESMEGRLRYMNDRVGYSTLTLVFYEKQATAFGFDSKFGEALKNGWTSVLWFVIGIANVWPFVLIAIGVIILVRLYNKRRKNKGMIQ